MSQGSGEFRPAFARLGPGMRERVTIGQYTIGQKKSPQGVNLTGFR